jgi:hypothetical protein
MPSTQQYSVLKKTKKTLLYQHLLLFVFTNTIYLLYKYFSILNFDQKDSVYEFMHLNNFKT